MIAHNAPFPRASHSVAYCLLVFSHCSPSCSNLPPHFARVAWLRRLRQTVAAPLGPLASALGALKEAGPVLSRAERLLGALADAESAALLAWADALPRRVAGAQVTLLRRDIGGSAGTRLAVNMDPALLAALREGVLFVRAGFWPTLQRARRDDMKLLTGQWGR